MSIFRRNKYLLISLGITMLTPSLCMANVMERHTYGVAISQEMAVDSISESALFVAEGGSDASGDGSIESPYATIKAALKNIKSGQTLYIRGGVYKENLTLNTSGKEDAYITICNYPGEDVILDHSGSSTEAIIDLNGQSYIQIEGLELRNNTNKWAYGFYLGNGESNIIIKNNKIHDLYASKPSASNSGANAIICYGERTDKSINNILIEGNEVYDCNTGWCEAISITGNCEYVSVINNRVRNTGNIGIDFCGNFGYCSDPSLDQPRYCVARGNVISAANSSYATSYGLYVDGSRDVLFENNIIYDSQGGIEVGAEEPSDYPTQNIIVRNNLVYNNSENGITVGGYYTGGGKAKNVKIYNNTVVNNGKENGELVISVVDDLEVANNIFYSEVNKALINSEFSSKYTSNIKFSHNLYYSKNSMDKVTFEMLGKTITGFENWMSTYEETGMFGKPIFKNAAENEYELVSGSMGINAGDNNIEAGEVDLAKKARHQGVIDCGAYEYGSTLVEVPDEPEVVPPTETLPDEPEVIPPTETLPEEPEVTPPVETPDTGDDEIKETITVFNEINKLQVGDKHFLKVALETTYADKTLTFATSDRAIAKVSANGNIKAMAEGEVVITITSAYGTKLEMPLQVVKDINADEDKTDSPTEETGGDQVDVPDTGDGEGDIEVPGAGDDNIETPDIEEGGNQVGMPDVGAGGEETEVPEEGNDEDKIEGQNLVPTFKEDTWEKVSGYKELEIINDYSLSLKTPKSWEGISLWGYEGLGVGQNLEIGYEYLGENNFVQVWADGKCLVDLSGSEMTQTYFMIPEDIKNVDICIVSSKRNTFINIGGFYIKSAE